MNRRILFVEDNPVLLQLYGLMLTKERDAWEVVTAPDGETALALLARMTFEVIVSDMRMPGMDGIQLMHEVKSRYPGMARIILSGLSDQKEIAECLGETHQFIAKPFDAKTLKATLTRLFGLETYLRNERLRTLVTRLDTLPSFPTLYVDIMSELATENPSLENIAHIVEQDPAMTAKMLQIANSAAFGLARKVNSPYDAVQYVGTGTVRSLALSAHVFSAFEKTEIRGLSLPRLWEHAIRTASLARSLLRHSGVEPGEAEEAYAAGMLHDIGKMMLAANATAGYQQAVNLAHEHGRVLHEAEQEVLGATHAGVGAYLLGLWGLPATIVEAVAFHHHPAASQGRQLGALTAVHVASALEHELCGAEPNCPSAGLEEDYLAAVGVGDFVNEWRAEALRLVQRCNDADE